MVDPEEPRLKTELRVKAGLRQCQSAGVFAALVRRGDADAGSLMIKLNLLDGTARVLVQQRDLAGRLIWTDTHPDSVRSDADVEAYLGRAAHRDPDLWVVEVEGKSGWHPF
jgi:hypothetical protein